MYILINRAIRIIQFKKKFLERIAVLLRNPSAPITLSPVSREHTERARVRRQNAKYGLGHLRGGV